MLNYIKMFLVLTIMLLTVNTSHANNSGMSCLSTQWDGDNLVFKNSCNYNIYVMYCSPEKKISGKYCGGYKGSAKNKGTYYTHTFNLKAGKTKSKWKPKNLQYGACKGMAGFGRSFTDKKDGSYSCEKPRRMYD